MELSDSSENVFYMLIYRYDTIVLGKYKTNVTKHLVSTEHSGEYYNESIILSRELGIKKTLRQ